MAGISVPNFEPHLIPLDMDGNRCERRQAVYWAVVMKTGPGQYEWLTDKLLKRGAAREMRRIREEMARLWWAQRDQRQKTAI